MVRGVLALVLDGDVKRGRSGLVDDDRRLGGGPGLDEREVVDRHHGDVVVVLVGNAAVLGRGSCRVGPPLEVDDVVHKHVRVDGVRNGVDVVDMSGSGVAVSAVSIGVKARDLRSVEQARHVDRSRDAEGHGERYR